MYCRAMQRVLANVTGEVSVLLPNDADAEIRASLEAYVRSTGRSADAFEQSAVGEAYAKANIFLSSPLRTGTMSTLDGKAHTMVCEKDRDEDERCTIDGLLKRSNKLGGMRNTIGSVYLMFNVTPGISAQLYLPF